MYAIANFIDQVLSNIEDDSIIKNVRNAVQEMCDFFKLYPQY